MATKYYAVLTNVGAAKLANATALGAQVEITQMAVGDGNGVLPTPNPAQTALVHELRRKPLNSLSIDPNNANQIIAEQVIPEDEGGWWIREIGLFDKDGDMIAVANCAETYKPQLQEGSGRVQVVRMILIVSSTAAVTLKIDPSVVLATRQYVDDQIIQVKSYVDQKMAAHVAAADPHKQYAPKESPALTGRPTAPTAEGKDSSTQIANTAFVQAAIAALVGSSPEALDTLNELAAALGNDPNFATTVTNSLAGKMDKSANGSDIENVSVFLQNLGLGEARYVIQRGANANGAWIRWSDGAIEVFGAGGSNDNGLAKVVYPIALPKLSRFISIAERIRTDYGSTSNNVHVSMIVDDQITNTGFYVRCQMYDGKPSTSAFSWRVYCAPV
ncbi:TPA: phage tail protein [Klebsiella pneumoniae]|nr:phage tail protein [Klebsiella pneumoniae]